MRKFFVTSLITSPKSYQHFFNFNNFFKIDQKYYLEITQYFCKHYSKPTFKYKSLTNNPPPPPHAPHLPLSFGDLASSLN